MTLAQVKGVNYVGLQCVYNTVGVGENRKTVPPLKEDVLEEVSVHATNWQPLNFAAQPTTRSACPVGFLYEYINMLRLGDVRGIQYTNNHNNVYKTAV